MLVEGDLGRLIALIVGFHLCRLRHVSVHPLTRVDRVASIAMLPTIQNEASTTGI
jgi:hypothetical protein